LEFCIFLCPEEKCLGGSVDNFTLGGAIFFSVEAQTTTGFGDNYPASLYTDLIFCLQALFGVILDACVIAIVHAKFSRPTKRAETVIFSKMALIQNRDNIPCLCFRMTSTRKHQIIEGHLSLFLVGRHQTQEGESYIRYQKLEIEETLFFLEFHLR